VVDLENLNDISPPGEDDERLSKQDDGSQSGGSNGKAADSSSSGELPRNDVPEVFSEEEEEGLDTVEM